MQDGKMFEFWAKNCITVLRRHSDLFWSREQNEKATLIRQRDKKWAGIGQSNTMRFSMLLRYIRRDFGDPFARSSAIWLQMILRQL